MTEPTAPEMLTEEIPAGVCPNGGCSITFPADAKRIECGNCGKRFQLAPDDPEEPQEPQEPAEPVEPPSEPVEPTEPAEEPQEPEEPAEPVEPPTVEEEQEAIHATPEPQEPQEPTEPEEPQHPEDASPPGAGDAANPSEVRKANAEGASRVTLEPLERPDGCSKFIYQTREFQWVARGGKGNPYGPKSISNVIFDIVATTGDEGIDPVDVAVRLRDSLSEMGKSCTSILQRVSAVIERTNLNKFVGLMEKIEGTDKVRVVEEHRGEIVAPEGLGGERADG